MRTDSMDLQAATERAVHVRGSRLVMAADGRWIPGGDLPEQTAGKLAECLWWILVLAHRLDVDIDEAYTTTMNRIQSHLGESLDSRSAGD